MRFAGFLAVAFMLSLFAASPGHAAANPDAAVMKAYTLSMDKLNRFAAAVTEAEKAIEADPELQAEREAMDMEPSGTLADNRARYIKHPKLFAFFQRQGLSMDDVVVAPAAAGNALAAISQPDQAAYADFVSPANLQFARQNQAALHQFFMTIQ